MSYLKSVERAIGYIEKQIIEEGLSVSTVCDQVGISKWYFQRIFKGVTGDTIGDYIRKRRMSLAATELVRTNRPIIQLAMDYGFESQEAFTRSFKSHFECTPAQLRKSRDPKKFMHKFHLTKEFLIHLKERLIMEPIIEQRKEMKLVGFKKNFRGIYDENPNNHEVIPMLWKELMARFDEIPNKVMGNVYGIIRCSKQENSEKLEYMAAIEVNDLGEIPEGMVSFIFPEGRLAKFTHKGSPSGIDKTVKYIFGTWLPQSKNQVREGLELEIYPQNYDPQEPNSSFEYCLALQ